MKNSQKGSVIVLLIILIALVVSVVYYFQQKKKVVDVVDKQEQVINWEGTYTFGDSVEGIGSPIFVVYELIVKPGGSAVVIAEGFQRYEKVNAIISQKEVGLDVAFDSYDETDENANITKMYLKGDILFSLTRIDDKKFKATEGKMLLGIDSTDKNNIIFEKTATVANSIESYESISWEFKSEGINQTTQAQRTRVTLVSGAKRFDAGVYDGSCSVIEKGVLEPGEVSGVLCWFAGFGDEVGVFKDGDSLVVKHGEQQEGGPNDQGFRGNFKTLFEIK